MTRFLFVVNPRAGRHRALARAGHAARLLRDRGHQVTITVTPTAAAAVAQLRDAHPETAVIACGGDGTVHGLIAPCLAADQVLGVLPAGSGDDIARLLGVHGLTTTALVDLWCEDATQLVDVGRIEPFGEFFLGVLSAGFDSRVNERANRSGTRRYVPAMLAELRHAKAVMYRASLDGAARSGKALLVCVGNGRTYGSGMAVCPNADCQDGLLDVTWVDEVPIWTFLRLFPLVYSGKHLTRSSVHSFRARSITLDASGQIAYADGERIGPLPIEVCVRPAALRVFSRTAAA